MTNGPGAQGPPTLPSSYPHHASTYVAHGQVEVQDPLLQGKVQALGNVT